MDIKDIKNRKKKMGLTNAVISKESGVPLGTVQKIFSGATAHPRYDTLLAIEKVLQDAESRFYNKNADPAETRSGFEYAGEMVREKVFK